MDFQLISAIVFFILMGIFLIIKRKNIEIQKIFFPIIYFAMYRTKLGISAMESFAKRFSKPLHFISYFMIGIGFLGMIVIVFSLFHNLWNMLTSPAAAPGVGLVLPFKVKGSFYVPFFYWIISIFIIALIHEFSHGIYAKLHGIRIKSSGFAFLNIILPILPAAFVEPDEKQLEKATRKQQLDVLAAGAFSNILLGFLVLGLMIGLNGPVGSIMEQNGVKISDFSGSDLPAEQAGMSRGDVIIGVDGEDIRTVNDFMIYMSDTEPGQVINIETEKGSYPATLAPNPEDESKSMLGVMVEQEAGISPSFAGGENLGKAIMWIMGLLYWLFVLNVGIGLFNLAPLGPIDGGKMLLVVLEKYTTKERAHKIWKNVSFGFLILLLINILPSFF